MTTPRDLPGERAPEWSLERFCGLLSRSAPELRAQVAGRLGSELEPAWAWLAVEADRRIEELRRDPALYDPWPAPRRSRPSRARSARAPVSARRLPTDDALLDIPAAVFIEALTGNVAAGGMVRCPLPDHEDRTPSCSIADGLWRCHGCGAGGDVYTLFAELEGYPTPLRGPAFVEVRRALLERFAGGLRVAA